MKNIRDFLKGEKGKKRKKRGGSRATFIEEYLT
jgi:hypothetical protein